MIRAFRHLSRTRRMSGWPGNCDRIQLGNERRGLKDVKQPDRPMESVPRVAGFSANGRPRLGATQAGAKSSRPRWWSWWWCTFGDAMMNIVVGEREEKRRVSIPWKTKPKASNFRRLTELVFLYFFTFMSCDRTTKPRIGVISRLRITRNGII